MRQFITGGPPADGRHPTDSDLHQMTDDGCPLGPDPIPGAEDNWRDNLGTMDTFTETEPTATREAGKGVTVGRPATGNGRPPADGDRAANWSAPDVGGGLTAYFV